MPVKKKSAKNEKPKKEPTWDQIGQMVGKKIESSDKCCPPWNRWPRKPHHDHGFFGRALFIIGVLIALNTLGTLDGVSVWIQVLIGIGFAFMRL